MAQTAGSPARQVDWLPWGRAAFARAADERRPVLLALGAAWCPACAGMARATWRDAAVCDLVERHYVAVRVDAERRPDIADRYTLGGWPTTAFLTPDGQVLGGETYVDPPRMAWLLQRVAGEFARRREELAAAPPPPAEPETPFVAADPPAWMEQQLLAACDPLHGGFGAAPRRLHAPALGFGLRRIAAGHDALLEPVTRTLAAALEGELFDAVEGGAFRYCAGRDWTAPGVEKLLAVNAEALDVLLAGWSVLDDARCRERAAAVIRYVQQTLTDRGAGGFRASQYADARYFAAGAEERARLAAPPVDRSVYADGNARMAAALLHAADRFDDSALAELAAAALERVVGATWERGEGIAHAADSGEAVRGLLADQVWTSAALLDLHAAAEREVDLDMAQELMRFALRHLYDPATGRFRDRVGAADDVGLLAAPLFPFETNCLAAQVLARLARLTDQDDFRRPAEAVLAALAPAAQARGVDAAAWVLAGLDLEIPAAGSVVDFAAEAPVSSDRSTLIPALQTIAARLRIESVRATTEAGSGHPSSCCSAADIVAALFFGQMRFDPQDPQHDHNDRFVLSKGHAAPLLYAAWAEAGYVDRADLTSLRKLESDLEGHPTPRLPFVDVTTGSLGQGICAAIGMALNARRLGSDYRTYVLLGDGESAEGSVWEAAQVGARLDLDNLCAITDVNGYGQTRETQWGHDMEAYARRWRAFGWHAIVVDGHDLGEVLDALDEARGTRGRPTAILARTVKGHGVPQIAGVEGWHGKPIPKGADLDRAIAELERGIVPGAETPPIPPPPTPAAGPPAAPQPAPDPDYNLGDMVATRVAYGAALAALGAVDPRVVALDADVGNSTFSETFAREHPDRFYQTYIAEQVMVGAAAGLASRGAIPFPSSFGCFLTRASDFIRMAGIGDRPVNIKLAGSHAGVSIGEDGPSQMALEDLAMTRAVPGCAVLYPCDAVSAWRLVMAAAAHEGMVYIRTGRPKNEVIYPNAEQFEVGGSKTLHASDGDAATVVAAGVTVYEARQAYRMLQEEGIAVRVIDAYSVQPIDAETMVRAGLQSGGRIITVEDHYAVGGLGDAVSDAVAGHGVTVERLAVREAPRSGAAEELLDRYGISAARIADAVRRQLAA